MLSLRVRGNSNHCVQSIRYPAETSCMRDCQIWAIKDYPTIQGSLEQVRLHILVCTIVGCLVKLDIAITFTENHELASLIGSVRSIVSQLDTWFRTQMKWCSKLLLVWFPLREHTANLSAIQLIKQHSSQTKTTWDLSWPQLVYYVFDGNSGWFVLPKTNKLHLHSFQVQ